MKCSEYYANKRKELIIVIIKRSIALAIVASLAYCAIGV